jgi:hypothetical protein
VLRAIGLAFRAVAVATRVIAVLEGPAVVTAIARAAEGGGATLDNGGEGVALGWPERPGVRGEIRRSRRADDVRQLDHGRATGRAFGQR